MEKQWVYHKNNIEKVTNMNVYGADSRLWLIYQVLLINFNEFTPVPEINSRWIIDLDTTTRTL